MTEPSSLADAKAKKNQPMTEAEKQAYAIAYYTRHGLAPGKETKQWKVTEGLAFTWNQEGIWLDFTTKDGLTAAIHMDMIGPQGHPNSIIQKCIDTWQKEFTETHKDA